MVESQTLALGDSKYTVDRYGFLEPPEQWTEAFADAMARRLGIRGGLTAAHWSFIRYLRHKFIDEEIVPVVVTACADNDLRLGVFKQLFPMGYLRGACRIAGISYAFMYKINYWLTYETGPMVQFKHKLNKLGYLEDFEQWDEAFATAVLEEWGGPTGLSGRRREVVDYLRGYYGDHRNIPTVCETCRENNLSLEDLSALFPAGYRRGACRLAGLPFFA